MKLHLSYLLIDTASDPAIPRPGRRWVLNPYRVHQRLWMAFPSPARGTQDEHFLDPFLPADFACGDETQHGFLFRVDPVPARFPSRHVVTVQSALKPDWSYAFQNAPEYLCGEKQDSFTPSFQIGQQWRFRLRANPTQRLRAKSIHPDGHPVNHWCNEKGKGRRIGIHGEVEQRAWLARKGEQHGFRVVEPLRCEADGLARSRKGDDSITLASVRFEGVLEVTDATAFFAAVVGGIGTAKGLGFGLLSLAAL